MFEGQTVTNKILKVVKNFLNHEIVPIGCILDSKIVTRSIKEQTPFYLTYSNSEVTKCIDSIATHEVGYKPKKLETNNIGITKFISKFKSLFSKN